MHQNDDLILADFPNDKELTYVELLTRHLNWWRSRLVRRTSEYYAAVSWKEENPGEMIATAIDQMTGEKKYKSISSVIGDRVQVVVEAKHYVLALEKMLEEAKKGDADLLAMVEADKIVDPSIGAEMKAEEELPEGTVFSPAEYVEGEIDGESEELEGAGEVEGESEGGE